MCLHPLSYFSSALPTLYIDFLQKKAVAVAHCKKGNGVLKVNGYPIEHIRPEAIAEKVLEPIRLLGQPHFANVDIRIKVSGGGQTAQVYGMFLVRPRSPCLLLQLSVRLLPRPWSLTTTSSSMRSPPSR